MDGLKAAFVGFRHMHIFDVYAELQRQERIKIVAACEEDPHIRKCVAEEGRIALTHSSFQEMLESADFDLLVVGDIFDKRGQRIIAGLRAGKHVLSDKPICTELKELRRIQHLSDRLSLVVGAVLELRDSGAFRRTRRLIQSGTIGELRAVSFSGQHPLLLGSRPDWYFEQGNHGGTINDLAIHAVDILQWISGYGVREIPAARCWNAGLPAHPQFRNAAQLMMVMEGGCGVIGDVSYISPDGFRYSLPQYWRFNFWGDQGMLETGLNEPKIRLYRGDSQECEELDPAPDRPGGYVRDLLEGIHREGARRNTELFAATRACLRAQEAADKNRAGFSL